MHPGRLRAAGARRRLPDWDAIRRNFSFSLVSLGDNNFVDVIDKKVEKLVSVLLHVIVELFLLFTQPGDELFWGYRAHLLFLCGDGIKSEKEPIVSWRRWSQAVTSSHQYGRMAWKAALLQVPARTSRKVFQKHRLIDFLTINHSLHHSSSCFRLLHSKMPKIGPTTRASRHLKQSLQKYLQVGQAAQQSLFIL